MPKKKKISTSDFSARMENLREVVSELNKDFKGEVATLAEDGMIGDVHRTIPTGCAMLDSFLRGGIPLGRMVQISGRPGVGKSTLASRILGNCQKEGGIAIVLDAEKSWTSERVKSLGLDPTALIQFEVNTVEDGFSVIQATLNKLHDSSVPVEDQPPIVIVWDTIAATPTTKELDPEAVGNPMDKPKILARGIRRSYETLRMCNAALIFVNQVITKLAGPAGASEDVPGGWGLKFGVSQDIRLKEAFNGAINLSGEKVGNMVQIRTMKNKIHGSMTRDFQIKIPFLYDRGFDSDLADLFFLVEGTTLTGSTKKLGGDCDAIRKKIRGMYEVDFNGTTHKVHMLDFKSLVDETEGMREWLRGLVEERLLRPSLRGSAVSDVEEN